MEKVVLKEVVYLGLEMQLDSCDLQGGNWEIKYYQVIEFFDFIYRFCFYFSLRFFFG